MTFPGLINTPRFILLLSRNLRGIEVLPLFSITARMPFPLRLLDIESVCQCMYRRCKWIGKEPGLYY